MSRRLSTQDHCRQALAWLYREVEADRMPLPKAKCLTYICLSLSGVLAEHQLEERIQKLEQAHAAKASRRAA